MNEFFSKVNYKMRLFLVIYLKFNDFINEEENVFVKL